MRHLLPKLRTPNSNFECVNASTRLFLAVNLRLTHREHRLVAKHRNNEAVRTSSVVVVLDEHATLGEVAPQRFGKIRLGLTTHPIHPDHSQLSSLNVLEQRRTNGTSTNERTLWINPMEQASEEFGYTVHTPRTARNSQGFSRKYRSKIHPVLMYTYRDVQFITRTTHAAGGCASQGRLSGHRNELSDRRCAAAVAVLASAALSALTDSDVSSLLFPPDPKDFALDYVSRTNRPHICRTHEEIVSL